MINREQAEWIVDAILYDMSDRRGLRQELDAIDKGIKNEMRDSWIALAIHASQSPFREPPHWVGEEKEEEDKD